MRRGPSGKDTSDRASFPASLIKADALGELRTRRVAPPFNGRAIRRGVTGEVVGEGAGASTRQVTLNYRVDLATSEVTVYYRLADGR